MKHLITKNIAQIWYTDFVLGFTFFILIAIITLRLVSSNYILPTPDLDDIIHSSKKISESLVSAGVPDNWTLDNIVMPGLTDGDYVLSQTKLSLFKNLTQNNYTLTKFMFGSNYDYIVFFVDKNESVINLTDVRFYGKPGENSTTVLNQNDIITLSRFLVYKDENNTAQIIKMRLFVWR